MSFWEGQYCRVEATCVHSPNISWDEKLGLNHLFIGVNFMGFIGIQPASIVIHIMIN
jgi:hypothetical protein